MKDSRGSIWTQSDWLQVVRRWIHDTLSEQAIKIIGEIEQPHLQPWSTVMQIPTNIGNVYFKASAPVIAHEPEITRALYGWRPDCIPEVLAIENMQGWMLMRDGGQRLREEFGENGDIQYWEDILKSYANLQKDLVDHVDELLELGSRDRKLASLPKLYDQLLSETDWLMIDEQEGLTATECQQLRVASQQVVEKCEKLSEYGIPDSLHHNDLHDGNIFSCQGRVAFFDWGDSSISHPFFSLRTVFISIENTFRLNETHPAFDHLSKIYLETWKTYQTEENLIAAFNLARQLWAISSAIKYKTLLSNMPIFRDEYSGAIPSLLKEFLHEIAII